MDNELNPREDFRGSWRDDEKLPTTTKTLAPTGAGFTPGAVQARSCATSGQLKGSRAASPTRFKYVTISL